MPPHDDSSPGEKLFATVVDRAHLCSPEDVPELIADAAAIIDVRDVGLYVVDYGQERLVQLRGDDGFDIDNSVPGRAFRTVLPVEIDDDRGRRVWLPLLDGTSRVGVMGVTMDARDDVTRRRCERLAGLAAELIISKSNFGDAIVRRRRSRPLTLAAEMQWELLPPLTFSNRQVVVTGVLEPSYEIAGDTFDYAFNGGVLHLALIDAMGHGFEATLVAAVAIGAYRHSRRRGDDLQMTYAAMDAVIEERFGPERFATAQLAELDVTSGRVRSLNAGHPEPMLFRDGRAVGRLETSPSLPVGMGGGEDSELCEYSLQPGDLVVWYTDGVVEARSEDGDFFGEQRLAEFVVRAAAAGMPAPETLRRLNQAVLAHQGGRLQDDATTVLVEWHGADPDERRGGAGEQRGAANGRAGGPPGGRESAAGRLPNELPTG